MAQLFVLSGPDVGKSYGLRHGDTVGRSPECVIALKHGSISRHHAHFECVDDEWFVVDDGSRNGVIVDKARVQRTKLADMQEFQLGELLLRFRSRDLAGAAPASAPAAPAHVTPPPPVADEDEIVLEGADEVVLEEPPAPAEPERPVLARGTNIEERLLPTSISPRVPPPPPPQLKSTMLDTGFGPAPAGAAAGASIARGPRAPGERVLQYNKVENRPGLANADLSQLSGPVKLVIAVVAVVVMGVVAWLAFSGTSFLKERLGGGGGESVEESGQ